MNKRPRFIATVMRMALANLSHTAGQPDNGDGDDDNGMRFTCQAIERAANQWADEHPECDWPRSALVAAARGWYTDLMRPPDFELCDAWFDAYYTRRTSIPAGTYASLEEIRNMVTERDLLARQFDEHGVRGTQHLRFLMLALAAEVAASERI